MKGETEWDKAAFWLITGIELLKVISIAGVAIVSTVVPGMARWKEHMLDVRTGWMDKAFLVGGCNIKIVMLVRAQFSFPARIPFVDKHGLQGFFDKTHPILSCRSRWHD